MKSMKNLFFYTKPYKLYVALAPLLMALEVVMDLLQPLIMQKIIDTGIANTDTDYVVQMGLFMFVAAFVGLIGGVGCTIYSTRAAVNFATDIRQDVFKKISYLSNEDRESFGVGKLITIIMSDISSVQTALMITLRIFVRGPLLFIGSVIIVYFQARDLFPILMILIPILLCFIIFLSAKAGSLFKKVQEKVDQLNLKLSESIAGIRVIKAFVRKDFEISRFMEKNHSLTNAQIKAEQIITILMPILLFVINGSIVIALLFGVIDIGEDIVQVGMILAFINYLNIILMALMTSSTALMQLIKAFPSANRIVEVLTSKNHVENSEAVDNVLPLKGRVQFKNVSFSYKDNSENILKNISFSVTEGEKIGIVGRTGSGKSTLVKLLARLYDSFEGEILVDDMNVRDIELNTLRSSLGYVTQNPFLFSGSIKNNLKFGKTDATHKELCLASEHACLSDYIEKLNEGYDYHLTQGATNLSGGQKQRLSMARAFVRKPAILILDDATSAVDARVETFILQALKTNFQHTTTFMIASKISSIYDADKILVLDDGKLVAEGTHHELLKSCLFYQEIYETQTDLGGVVVE